MYVIGLEVRHKSIKGAPTGYIKQDINKGICRRYTYIKAQTSSERALAVSSFKMVLRDEEDKAFGATNLNKGAKGKSMYLIPTYDDNELKVNQIHLTQNISEANECLIDINEKRKGQPLYLSWDTEEKGASLRNT